MEMKHTYITEPHSRAHDNPNKTDYQKRSKQTSHNSML